MGSGTEVERMNRKKTSPVGWFPRGRTESYLDRKIRLLQESQGGMKASLDETLASSRHLSRIEREKRAALSAAQEATETRKIALVEASWCRILKAARITQTSAAAELHKAEKKASEAFHRAAALGVVLKSNAQNPEFTPRTPSRHKITASLDTAFEVDEEVAAALKFAFEQVGNASSLSPADEMDTENSDIEQGAEEETCNEEEDGEEEKNGLNALMLERVRNLEPEQRESLASLVATRGLNAIMKEESDEQDLKNWKGGLGDVLVKHVSRLEAEKAAAAKQASKEDEQSKGPGPRKKTASQADVPDLGSMLVKHVSRIEREKQQAKTQAQTLATTAAASSENCTEEPLVQVINREPLLELQGGTIAEVNNTDEYKDGGCQRKASDSGWPSLDELQPVKKISRLEMEKQSFARQGSNNLNRRKQSRDLEAASAWGGLDLGSSLKRHVSKLEAEQAAWRRAAEKAGNQV